MAAVGAAVRAVGRGEVWAPRQRAAVVVVVDFAAREAPATTGVAAAVAQHCMQHPVLRLQRGEQAVLLPEEAAVAEVVLLHRRLPTVLQVRELRVGMGAAA